LTVDMDENSVLKQIFEVYDFTCHAEEVFMAVSDEDMKAAVSSSDDEDHLYWKAYGAGIVFVIISLTFQGCLFYTCQVALSLSLSLSLSIYIYIYIYTCCPFSCVRDSASLRFVRPGTLLTFCRHVSAWRFQFRR